MAGASFHADDECLLDFIPGGKLCLRAKVTRPLKSGYVYVTHPNGGMSVKVHGSRLSYIGPPNMGSAVRDMWDRLVKEGL